MNAYSQGYDYMKNDTGTNEPDKLAYAYICYYNSKKDITCLRNVLNNIAVNKQLNFINTTCAFIDINKKVIPECITDKFKKNKSAIVLLMPGGYISYDSAACSIINDICENNRMSNYSTNTLNYATMDERFNLIGSDKLKQGGNIINYKGGDAPDSYYSSTADELGLKTKTGTFNYIVDPKYNSRTTQSLNSTQYNPNEFKI